MNTIKAIEQEYLKKDVLRFNVGDTVKVLTKIREEGDKFRLHPFEGVVIAKKGSSVQANFTVRKVSSGEGIERVFFIHSPSVERIELIRSGRVKRAKLYYLRGKIGRRATKIKSKGKEQKAEAKA